MVLFELAALLIGLAVVSFFSEKTVECSTHVANKLKVPPLVIGILLISVGTDIPEIANSIFSSYSGHGDINVGDTLGSSLTQITLVLGLVAILGGTIKAHRKNVLILGACATAAVALAAIIVMDGELTRFDAGFLILAYAVLLAISVKFTIKEYGKSKDIDISCIKDKLPMTFARVIVYLIFVVIGAAVVVGSAIELSNKLGLSEYFISFFVIGMGTSLPELSVELAALRKKRYGLLLGDLMGSNITDATLALGIGPLLFPTDISAGIVTPLAFYVVAASLAVVGLFAWRGKVDKRLGAVFVGIYLLSLVFTCCQI